MTKSTIAETQQAIKSLSKSDYAQLRRWLNEYDWEEWDQQIETDSDDGKLDFLVDQATEAKRQGTLEDLSKDCQCPSGLLPSPCEHPSS